MDFPVKLAVRRMARCRRLVSMEASQVAKAERQLRSPLSKKAQLVVKQGSGGMPQGCVMHVEIVTEDNEISSSSNEISASDENKKIISINTEDAKVWNHMVPHDPKVLERRNNDDSSGSGSSSYSGSRRSGGKGVGVGDVVGGENIAKLGQNEFQFTLDRSSPENSLIFGRRYIRDVDYVLELDILEDLPKGTPIKACKVSLEGYKGAVWPLKEYVLFTHHEDGSIQECHMRRIDPMADTKALLQHNPLSHLAPPLQKKKEKQLRRTPDFFKPNLNRFPSSVVNKSALVPPPPSPSFPSRADEVDHPATARTPSSPSLRNRINHGPFGQQLLVPKSLMHHSRHDSRAKQDPPEGFGNTWPSELLAEAKGKPNPNSDFQVSERGPNGGFFGDDVFFWSLATPTATTTATATTTTTGTTTTTTTNERRRHHYQASRGACDYPITESTLSEPPNAYFGIFDGVDVWRRNGIAPSHYSFSHVFANYALDRLLTYNTTDPYRMATALEGALHRAIKNGLRHQRI